MKSLIAKRSIVVAGHKTSVSLEEPFWKMLKEIAVCRNIALSDLVASIDQDHRQANLSSAIRLFVLEFCRIQFGQRLANQKVAQDAAMARASVGTHP
jgi:predicted DNA-binding ribbon-helix-helix protein